MSDQTRGPSDGDPDVGSVGEEAAKLLGALSEWAQSQGADAGGGIAHGLGNLAGQAAHAVGEINDHLATGSAECTYCPVCRTVHVIRQASPEVKAHLTSAASSFLQAMAGMLATLPSAGAQGATTRKDFERIDLEDDL